MCTYEVKIRAYEVKISAYEVKICAGKVIGPKIQARIFTLD